MNATNDTFRIAIRKFGPFESALKKIWEGFCRQTGCTLRVEMVPMDLHQLHESLLEKEGLKKGDWDVAHIVTDWLYEAYTSGALENLAPHIEENPPQDFPQGWSSSLLAMQQFADAVVGLPFHDGPECLIYRKDLFEDPAEQLKFRKQYGRELQPPQTWEAFQQVARFFQRPAENLYGCVFAGFPDGHNTVFDFALQVWTRNGSLVDVNGLVAIHTQEAIAALEFYRQLLRDEKAIHPQSHQYESVQAGTAFARGEVAMMVNWFGFASMCEVIESSKVKGRVDITSLPKGNNGLAASLNVYWLYCIGSGSKFKEVAYDFIRYAVAPDQDKMVTMEGGIGCRISTWKDAEINNIIPYYHKLEQLHVHARSLPVMNNWAKIASIIDEVVLAAVNTNRPIPNLLRDAQHKIQTQQQNDFAYENSL